MIVFSLLYTHTVIHNYNIIDLFFLNIGKNLTNQDRYSILLYYFYSYPLGKHE